MKRLSLLIVFLSSIHFSNAQTLDDITKMINAKDFKNAQVAIDKHLADPANASKPDPWYIKGRVYNSLSYESLNADERASFKAAAFDAFKKNQQLDPKDVRLKLEFYRSYLDLYYGFYDLGANFFNDKKYDEAYNSFTKALDVKDYILAKNYTYTDAKIYPIDTALILNTAIAATQAKKEDVATTYYKKLVDANVSGKGYEEVYEYLVSYYNNKNDQASLQPILTKAKTFYPDNEYWSELEIKEVAKKGDQAALFAKYEEMIAKNPTNFILSYNYAIELYNSIYGKDAKEGDAEAKKAKLTEVLKKAIANDKGIDATMLMTNHLFNAASDLSAAALVIKGTKPEDVKKKSALLAQSNKLMDELIPYAENTAKYYESQASLKGTQKANMKIVYGYLADVYTAKKDAKKSAEYDKKRLAVN